MAIRALADELAFFAANGSELPMIAFVALVASARLGQQTVATVTTGSGARVAAGAAESEFANV